MIDTELELIEARCEQKVAQEVVNQAKINTKISTLLAEASEIIYQLSGFVLDLTERVEELERASN